MTDIASYAQMLARVNYDGGGGKAHGSIFLLLVMVIGHEWKRWDG